MDDVTHSAYKTVQSVTSQEIIVVADDIAELIAEEIVKLEKMEVATPKPKRKGKAR